VERQTGNEKLDRGELEELLVLLRIVVDDTSKGPSKQLAAALLAVRTEQELTRLRTRACDMPKKRGRAGT
jgi:hypothetical protein